MASKVNVKYESLLENIIETMQCFKCQAVPGLSKEQQNRYSCVDKSHQLCESCKASCECGSVVGKCPNPTIKQMLIDLPVYCLHYNNGCRQIFVQTQAESLDDHEKGCIFRQVFCPELSCKNKVLFKDVIEHLKKVHENKFWFDAPENKYTVMFGTGGIENDGIWKPRSIKIRSGIDFFIVGEIINKVSHFWLYIMASSLQAKNYTYTLSITGENGSKFSSNFSDYANSLDEGRQEIIKNQLVFMIGTEAIKKIRNDENMIEIEVTIHDLKEEAKDDDEESGVEDGSE